MCDAIKRIINNPEFSLAITTEGRKKAEDFDWENIKKLWIDVISQHD
jgi:glycosyltransferase involved in cell wall biosynthesis